jgi:hypothetical protein
VGHSIGVYMALHVARLLEEDGNEKKSKREGPGGVGEGDTEDSAEKEDKQGERIAKVSRFPSAGLHHPRSVSDLLSTSCAAVVLLGGGHVSVPQRQLARLHAAELLANRVSGSTGAGRCRIPPGNPATRAAPQCYPALRRYAAIFACVECCILSDA